MPNIEGPSTRATGKPRRKTGQFPDTILDSAGPPYDGGMTGDHSYDVAVSFAGAQREYVERVVRACEARGLRVFYDLNKTVDFWGRNLIYEMRAIYGGNQARYVVVFLSAEYLASAYPMDEFDFSTSRALARRDAGYILPILIGEVEIPERFLNPAVGYLRADAYTVDGLADVIAYRVRASFPPAEDAAP